MRLLEARIRNGIFHCLHSTEILSRLNCELNFFESGQNQTYFQPVVCLQLRSIILPAKGDSKVALTRPKDVSREIEIILP